MKVRGSVLVLVVALVLGLSFVATVLFSQGLRQEYRVASQGEAERTDLDLTSEYVVWLEQPGDRPFGRVVSYTMATRERVTHTSALDAATSQPIAADGPLAAWAEGAGPYRVRVADVPRNVSWAVGEAGDNLTLPGRTLEGDTLLVSGTHRNATGLWRVAVPPPAGAQLEPVKLASRARILDGSVAAWAPGDGPLVLSQGRVWWFDNATVHGFDLARGEAVASFEAGGRVTHLDADGDLVVWAEAHGRERRVLFLHLGNGTRGEVSAFPSDQHSPAVNGSRVVLVQADRLVRFKDLATGEERVLPARTQENIRLRLGPDWAAWLSGTIEGHNILLVPLEGDARPGTAAAARLS